MPAGQPFGNESLELKPWGGALMLKLFIHILVYLRIFIK